MLNFGQRIDLSGLIGSFIRKEARRPFAAFLALLLVEIMVVLGIFFIFWQLYTIEDAEEAKTVSAKKVFNAAKAKEYQEVFSIFQSRESEFKNNATTTSYPGVFKEVKPEKKENRY